MGLIMEHRSTHQYMQDLGHTLDFQLMIDVERSDSENDGQFNFKRAETLKKEGGGQIKPISLLSNISARGEGIPESQMKLKNDIELPEQPYCEV